MPPSETPSSTPELRRPRLQRSTYAFIVLLLILFLLSVVPGRTVAGPAILANGQYGPHFPTVEHREHGWPLAFLWREGVLVPLQPTNLWQGDWRLSSWRLWEGVNRFSIHALLIDLACALVVIGVLGSLFEVWRRRHRSFWQPHLGDLFLLTALIASLAAYLAYHRTQYRQELAILEKLEKTETSGTQWSEPIEQRAEWRHGGPGWIRALLGDDQMRIFDRVVAIDIGSEQINDAARLPHLKAVRVVDYVEDWQLTPFEECRSLEALNLMVGGCGPSVINKEGCARLPKLSGLRGLNLYECVFRGEGLEHMPRLAHLDLTDTLLDDEHASVLARLTRLKVLSLAYTKITAVSLQHLAELTELQELNLYGTDVSDEALRHLFGLKKLRQLWLGERKVTSQGVAELQKALPDCEIYWEP